MPRLRSPGARRRESTRSLAPDPLAVSVGGSYSGAMIGTLDVIVIDCPDPDALADFYAEVLGRRKFSDEPGWAEIVGPDGVGPIVAFQRVENYTPPQWPGQVVPQQMHLDVRVDDLDVGEAAVLAIGATRTGSETP